MFFTCPGVRRMTGTYYSRVIQNDCALSARLSSLEIKRQSHTFWRTMTMRRTRSNGRNDDDNSNAAMMGASADVEHVEETEEEDFMHHQHKEQEEDMYVWEKRYLGNWDLLEHPGLNATEAMQQMQLMEQRRKRQRLTQSQIASVVRRGIIRFMFLVIDLSQNAQQLQTVGGLSTLTPTAKDSDNANESTANVTISESATAVSGEGVFGGQSRQAIVLKKTVEFVREFFDQNPLSQLGIIVTRDGKAEKICDLTGKTKNLETALRERFHSGGLPSLQNALELAHSSLSFIPSYGFKEIVVLYSSLSTTDPGDIAKTIEKLKKSSVRCSVVGFGAEMFVLRNLTRETNGSYGIPINEENFKDLLYLHASPPPTLRSQQRLTAELIYMGFPKKRSEDFLSMCVCHKEMRPGGYICPRCSSKYCDLPTDCTVCNLKLVSSPHLARSYHHLFPVQAFVEIDEYGEPVRPHNKDNASQPQQLYQQFQNHHHQHDQKQRQRQGICFGCRKVLDVGASLRLQCPKCLNTFCVDCDAFVHESLHNCPGCE